MEDTKAAVAAAILTWRGDIAAFAAAPVFAAYVRLLEAGPSMLDPEADRAAGMRILAAHGVAPASFPGFMVRLLHEAPFRIGMTLDYAALGELGLALLRAAIVRPRVFLQDGDAEAYARFLEQVTDRILVAARRDPRHPAVVAFVAECLFVAAYFAQADLRSLFAKRAEIARRFLMGRGFDLDPGLAPRPAGGRIRLGILCNDASARTETFVTLPLFRHLDRANFEVWLLSQHPFDLDPHGIAVAQHAEHALVLPTHLRDQVARIRDLGLDVLVFATNVTAVQNSSFFLALHRLAPVQIANCCSPTSTGIPTIDHFLSGDLAEASPDPQARDTERLLRLRGTGLCFDYSLAPSPSPPLDRARLGIPAEAVVFASGAHMVKIGPETRMAWARILARTPGAVLVTYPYGGAWERNNPRQLFEARVRADLATQGVDPDRVKFLQPLNSRGNVKAVLALADIYLDSFPYGGANTIIDPLELGVPAIAMRGGFQRSQQGAAILDDLGLPDLAAKDAREYCDLAVFLGTKPVLRAAIAEQVRRRMRDRPRFLDAADHAAQIGAILHALVRPMPEGSGV